MTGVPVTRTLPALLRRELAALRRNQARLFVAEVQAVPDAQHVTITYDGDIATIARLVSYEAPVVGGSCWVLTAGATMIALGRTPP